MPSWSVNRSLSRALPGDVVSAISIRVPLSSAYARADHFSRHLTITLLATFLAIFVIQFLIYRYLIYQPIKRLRDKTAKIINNEETLVPPINNDVLFLSENWRWDCRVKFTASTPVEFPAVRDTAFI